MCAEVRDYAVEHLDDGGAILAVEETSFIKKGQESVGVQRQYCGLSGQKRKLLGRGVPGLCQRERLQLD